MKTEILLVTYRKDYDFTVYALQTVKKFGSGFSGITMVVPYEDFGLFQPLANEYGCTLKKYLVQPNKGFLHHMVVKCEADLWCPPGTEAVIHIDADCIFKEPFTPETFTHNGKPILVREHFEDFSHHPCRGFWRKNINSNLGFDCEWETMVRHPACFLIDLYPAFRRHIEQHHGMSFQQYVLLQREEFPYTFCEFPTLGAFILQFQPERYRIVTAVHTPGPYWADAKWERYGIRPLARHANGVPVDKESPWHFLWHLDNGSIEEHPLCSPIQYFWSRAGITHEYKKQIEDILSL